MHASRGEPDMFVAIFDRHFDAIHRYLVRRVGPDVGEELAAETFAEAFDSRARYRAQAADVRPWLYGIAANLLHHHYRRETRQLRAYARTGVDVLGDDESDSDARLDANAMGPRVAAALACLNRGEREALLLYAWADLGYEEIAAALGVPVGTVRSRLSRARSRIGPLLGHQSWAPKPVGRLSEGGVVG